MWECMVYWPHQKGGGGFSCSLCGSEVRKEEGKSGEGVLVECTVVRGRGGTTKVRAPGCGDCSVNGEVPS